MARVPQQLCVCMKALPRTSGSDPARITRLCHAVHSYARASMSTRTLCMVEPLRSERRPWALTTRISPCGSTIGHGFSEDR